MLPLNMYWVLIVGFCLFQIQESFSLGLAFTPGSNATSHRDIPPANFSLLQETETLAIASGNTTGLSFQVGKKENSLFKTD
ncbi:Hypothetical predicted protein, partial [Paramuricea clavata]